MNTNQNYQPSANDIWSKQSQRFTTPPLQLQEIKLQIFGVISSKVEAKIKSLCKKEPLLEWSGVVFFEVINSENHTTLILKDILLMDIGSSGYTTYTMDSSVLDFIISQGYRDLSVGHIHSHNNMNTFFSGTDTDQLIDGAKGSNMFFSLIVNNKYENTARVSFESENSSTFINFKGEAKTASTKSYMYSEVTLLSEAEYSFSDPDFEEIYKKVKKVKESRVPVYTRTNRAIDDNDFYTPDYTSTSALDDETILSFNIKKSLIASFVIILGSQYSNILSLLNVSNIESKLSYYTSLASKKFSKLTSPQKVAALEKIQEVLTNYFYKENNILSSTEEGVLLFEFISILEDMPQNRLTQGITNLFFK